MYTYIMHTTQTYSQAALQHLATHNIKGRKNSTRCGKTFITYSIHHHVILLPPSCFWPLPWNSAAGEGKQGPVFRAFSPLSGMWYQKNKTRQPKIHPFFPSPIPFGVVLHYGFSSSIGDRNTIFWRSCVLNHDGFTGRRKTGRKKM